MRTLLHLAVLSVMAASLSGCIIAKGPNDRLHISTLSEEVRESKAAASEIKRTYAGSFPIAQAVTVPPGYSTVYVSGMVPGPLPGTTDQYGDTEAQTESVLGRIDAALKAEGLGFGDVVNMKVYLVADPATGKMDFAGMMKSYVRHFGTPEQPNKPTRATVEVAALVAPAYLVEIEVVAVKKAD